MMNVSFSLEGYIHKVLVGHAKYKHIKHSYLLLENEGSSLVNGELIHLRLALIMLEMH